MSSPLSPERAEQVRALFHRVVDLPPAERSALLDRIGVREGELLHEVESLLEAHDRAGAILDRIDRQLPWPLAAPPAAAEDPPHDPLLGERVSHYQVLERLGSGGMGVVYKARDTQLDRMVALKFLPPHLGLDHVAAQRLLREAKAASALDHPNLCTVYEISQTDTGQRFLAMAYYDGETLQERVARGPLPVAQAVAFAVQVAQGLAAAHEAGIVHRDIKPANVLVTERGQVKLVDFGIARVAGQELTRPGWVMGTGAYMSPEQVRGEAVNPRTDLWSLGVLLYEMLSGIRPFRGDDERAVLHAIEHREPEALPRLRPEVPDGLARIVERLLRKEPAARYGSAEELLRELRTLLATFAMPEVRALQEASGPPVRRSGSRQPISLRRPGWGVVAASLLVVSLLVVLLWRQSPAPGTASAIALVGAQPGLAVLPLKNHSGDPAQDYFAEGMTEELITTLTKIEGLRVIAHRSVLQFRHSEQSVSEIARLLDVRYVVDGGVLQDGDSVRFTATLIDTVSNTPLWAERYQRERRDLLALQREVALAIARQVEVSLTPQDRARLAGVQQVDPEAFDLYVKGTQARYRWTEADFREAVQYFERAIARDPGYAAAYAGLALVEMFIGDGPRARSLAQKALELDLSSAEAHVAMGLIRQYYDWDWAGSEEAFRQAIRLNPGFAEAHHELSMLLMRLRRFDEALQEARLTLYLAPMSARFQLGFAEVLAFSGRSAEALVAAQRARVLDATWSGPDWLSGVAHLQAADSVAALEAFETAITRGCDCEPFRAHLNAAFGRRDDALAFLETAHERWTESRHPSAAMDVALVYAGLGDRERTLDWLERGAEPGGYVVYLAIDPWFGFLQDEPRFQALLRKVFRAFGAGTPGGAGRFVAGPADSR